MKGWIALDIDGTITAETDSTPQPVIDYLGHLHGQGWRIFFNTGRTFSFALKALHRIDFPYFLGVQNGADVLEMPSKTSVVRRYLDASHIPHLDLLYQGEEEDFLVFSGYEKGDFCFFRPNRFPLFASRLYLEKLKALATVPWKPVEKFEFGREVHFPLIQCLGSKETLEKIHGALQTNEMIQTSLIHCSVERGRYLLLITSAQANKGEALAALAKEGTVIAAGDDYNDIPMLKRARIPIVMSTAPQEILALGKIIAPPASSLGIIPALEKAVQQC